MRTNTARKIETRKNFAKDTRHLEAKKRNDMKHLYRAIVLTERVGLALILIGFVFLWISASSIDAGVSITACIVAAIIGILFMSIGAFMMHRHDQYVKIIKRKGYTI